MTVSVCFVHEDSPRLCGRDLIETTERITKCDLEYLNEGGANFVFRILPTEGHELPALLKGKLLRLRKDLPTVPSAQDQLQALNANFRGLFPPGNVVQHELIAVDEALPQALNESLRAMDRPEHRAADVLPADDKFGLLVTDMTPKAGDVLLQLKPKWLAQSPSAPPASKRCRTCAMRAQRASRNIRTATDAQESCPLDLLSVDSDERKRAIHAITSDEGLRNFLLDQAQPLLGRLKSSQISLDPDGMLKVSSPESIRSVCKAMTLRDCTLFLKRSGGKVDARLGDLDLKQPEKFVKWKKVESSLINDGWYTNEEHSAHWKAESICQLSRV